MKGWHGYAQFYGVGNPSANVVLRGHVSVEEKINGSLLACRMEENGLVFHPAGEVDEELAQRLTAQQYNILPGTTFWLEVVSTNRQDLIDYPNLPQGGAVLLDVKTSEGRWLSHEEKFQMADQIGVLCAPMLHEGYLESAEQLQQILQMESVLGGDMEGIVIKPLVQLGDGKIRFLKFQREAFLCKVPFRPAADLMAEGMSMRDIDVMLRSGQQRGLRRVPPASPVPDSALEVSGSGDGDPTL